jgi:hypothetical protein
MKERQTQDAINQHSTNLDNAVAEYKKQVHAGIQKYQDEQDNRNNEAYQTAFAKATKAIQEYKGSSNPLPERSLKVGLSLYSVNIMDKNLENLYKENVNKLLIEKGLSISL